MTLAPELVDHFLSIVGLGVLSTLTFLVRHYFISIQTSISNLAIRFDAIDAMSKSHQTEIAVIKSELSAIWRTLDPPRRLHDSYSGNEES